MTLHLRLLVGQLVVLHFEAGEGKKARQRKEEQPPDAASSSCSLQEVAVVLTCGTGPAETGTRP